MVREQEIVDSQLQELYRQHGVKWEIKQRKQKLSLKLNAPNLDDKPCPLQCGRCGLTPAIKLYSITEDYSHWSVSFNNLREVLVPECPVSNEVEKIVVERNLSGYEILDAIDEVSLEGCLVFDGNKYGFNQESIIHATLARVARNLTENP